MQRIHKSERVHSSEAIRWLENLTTETDQEGNQVHSIQQFQIIECHHVAVADTHYQAVVLCNHKGENNG